MYNTIIICNCADYVYQLACINICSLIISIVCQSLFQIGPLLTYFSHLTRIPEDVVQCFSDGHQFSADRQGNTSATDRKLCQ